MMRIFFDDMMDGAMMVKLPIYGRINASLRIDKLPFFEWKNAQFMGG